MNQHGCSIVGKGDAITMFESSMRRFNSGMAVCKLATAFPLPWESDFGVCHTPLTRWFPTLGKG
jgi:hypothetical protein